MPVTTAPPEKLFPHLDIDDRQRELLAAQMRSLRMPLPGTPANAERLRPLFNRAGAALVIVDPQTNFVSQAWGDHGTPETEAAMGRIVTLKKTFNDHGLPVDIFYMDPLEKGVDLSEGGLCGIRAAPHDRLRPKEWNNIFWGTDYENEITGINTLVFSGFNFSFCMEESIQHALDIGKSVWLVHDATANGRRLSRHDAYDHAYNMMERGINLASAAEIAAAVAASNSARIESAAISPASAPTAGSQTPAAPSLRP